MTKKDHFFEKKSQNKNFFIFYRVLRSNEHNNRFNECFRKNSPKIKVQDGLGFTEGKIKKVS